MLEIKYMKKNLSDMFKNQLISAAKQEPCAPVWAMQKK